MNIKLAKGENDKTIPHTQAQDFGHRIQTGSDAKAFSSLSDGRLPSQGFSTEQTNFNRRVNRDS